jgi:hypothetical protein
MPKLTPIVRTSLTEPLLTRYNKTPSVANVGGGSAKDAGTSRDAVKFPGTQAIQSDFTVRQPAQVTEFQPAALNHAKTIGVDTTPYTSVV